MATVLERQPTVYAYNRRPVDPITFEVIRHRLISITDEQAATLAAISGSPLVNEATDYNTGIFRAHGEMVTMGKTVLLHAASVAEMIKHIIIDCEDDPGFRDGDMFLVNHPYKGALHAPDFGLVAPVFHDGKRICWIGVCCHQLDVGGMAPGGSFPEATDVQQEGVLVSPVRIVENGQFRSDILAMILGMSRLPTNMSLDFRGMLAANKVAIKRLTETIEHYGIDTVLSVMDETIDVTERELRNRLKELPDGVYRSQTFLDHDGEANRLYRIAVEVRKTGDKLVFDFSKSADQARRFMNCTPGGLLAGIRAAVLPILAYDLPWNDGIFRPIEVIAREGSIVCAKFPAPVSQGPLGAMWLVETVATNALSKMVATSAKYLAEAQASPNGGPDGLGMHGRNQYGEPAHNSFLDMIYAGGGAYAHRDGLSPQGHRHIPAVRLQNVERNEANGPILYVYRRLLPDSGGPGRNRGGLSAGVAYLLHDVDRLHLRMYCHCYELPTSFGIFGGYPGACNRRRFVRNADARAQIAAGHMPVDTTTIHGEEISFPAKMTSSVDFTMNDFYECGPSAGAGWGDPIDREPERVAADVRDNAVSAAMAREVYGVVATKDGTVDVKATAARREAIRKERLSWTAEKTASNCPADGAKAETLALAGDGVTIARVNGGLWFRCNCGHCIAPASENWKLYAKSHATTAAELGPRISLHKELEVRRYACPSCARLHDVEVKLAADAPLFDTEIKF